MSCIITVTDGKGSVQNLSLSLFKSSCQISRDLCVAEVRLEMDVLMFCMQMLWAAYKDTHF